MFDQTCRNLLISAHFAYKSDAPCRGLRAEAQRQNDAKG